MRMLYRRGRYVVRFAGAFSPSFRALAGILIGDPASPILWNLFFADFLPPGHPDDVVLDGRAVAFLAHGILLMSWSREGLRLKLAALVIWSRRNGVEINVSKTFMMIFGPIPRSGGLHLILDGQPIALVPSAVYVGMRITSTHRHIFAVHRTRKTEAARKVANTVLSLEAYVGNIPPADSRALYLGLIDPHLHRILAG